VKFLQVRRRGVFFGTASFSGSNKGMNYRPPYKSGRTKMRSKNARRGTKWAKEKADPES
jgi:hypothetical protein